MMHFFTPGPLEGVGLTEVAAIAQRSVVSVAANITTDSGSGWVALPNGIVVTSQRVVGYSIDVRVGFDGGGTTAGKVIAVDLRRDLAFVLPRKPLDLAPLPTGGDVPRMGEMVLVLRRHPRRGLGLAAGVMASIGPDEMLYETAAARGASGAPLLNVGGQVLGVCVVKEHSDTRTSGRESASWPAGFVVSVAAFQDELQALNQPASQLAGREPTYRCLTCDEPFTLQDDCCLVCGVLLPFAEPIASSNAGAHRVVKNLLQAVGVVANRARIGPRIWRFLHHPRGGVGPSEITFNLDEPAHHVFLRTPLVQLPRQNHEPFYRLLLTMNDLTTGPFRISIAASRLVVLSFTEPLASLRGRDFAATLRSLTSLAGQYRQSFSDSFGAEPRLHTADD